jgi:hypothetical protein
MTGSIYPMRSNRATPGVLPLIDVDKFALTDGQVARTRYTKLLRFRLGAAIMTIVDGTTQLEELTPGQIASLCRASLGYAHLIRLAQSAPRVQVAQPRLQAAE